MDSTVNDGRTTYRFCSFESGGTLVIESDSVRSNVRQGSTRFEFVTRLECLNPDPIRTWKTPIAFWLCLVVGGLAIPTAIAGLLESNVERLSFVSYLAVLALGLIVLCFAFLIRREEWVTFSGRDGACGVWYCRSGPDKAKFEAFTDELSSRITSKAA